jgi:predicted DNA-binding transcriptional regulator YafY
MIFVGHASLRRAIGEFIAQSSRHWQLLRMIPRHPTIITARDLQRRLEKENFVVSNRTIERDLMALSDMRCMKSFLSLRAIAS